MRDLRTMRIDRRVALAVAGVMLLASGVNGAEPPKGWERSLALGLTATSGNSDSVLFTSSLDGHRAWEKDDWLLGLKGAYGRSNGKQSVELGEGMAQYKRLFDEHWYATGVADLLHDGIAALAYRLTLSPGLGYYFIKSDNTKLNAEVGPAYVREKFFGKDPRDFMALRVAERFERKLNDNAKLWQSLEYLPQVNKFANYTVVGEVGVESALTKTMSLRVVGQDRYENRPPAGREHNDLSLVSALAYKF